MEPGSEESRGGSRGTFRRPLGPLGERLHQFELRRCQDKGTARDLADGQAGATPQTCGGL